MRILIPVLLVLVIITLVSANFTDIVGNRRVMIGTHKRNFFSARNVCRDHGMQLLTIHTMEENWQVVEILRRYTLGWTFFGLTDLAKEGEWRWHESGQLPLNTFFRQQNGGRKENCAVLERYADINWDDQDCDVLQSFICEELQDIVPHTEICHRNLN